MSIFSKLFGGGKPAKDAEIDKDFRIFPEPHIREKLKMLAAGELTKPLDIFDPVLQGLPWLALIAKLILTRRAV